MTQQLAAPVATAERATRRDWAALGVLATALAMIVLDGTIVGVALPTIIGDLRLDLTDAQWVNSLYSVVFAALLLTAGRLGDRWGRRRLLLVGVGLFTVGSALAGLAVATAPLLAARALQGVGGALILPATLSTVNATFRGADRAAAFGVWGAVMSGAAAVGPLLGGWLTDGASWRWIFWVNLPVGLAVALAALRLVPETRASGKAYRTDLPGPLLSALGLGLLVFGLIEGTALGWWAPEGVLRVGPWTWTAPVSAVPVAIALGLVALVALVRWESALARRGTPGVLDVGLFRLATFSWGNLTAGLVAVGEFALVLVLPLVLVTSMGLGPLGAGLVLASMAAGAFLSGAAARHLAAALGAARVVVLGLALEVLGAAATALAVDRLASPYAVALVLLPYGLGLGLASAQLTSTVLAQIPADRSGTGSATQSTVRQVGAAMGSALGGTVLAVALGTQAPDVRTVDPAVLAHAGSLAIWAAVAALAVGLVAALRVARVSVAAPTLST